MATNTARVGITITKAQKEFLQRQVDAGHFQNESDVLRDLLREKMEEKKLMQLEYLKQRIADSEASGISDLTPQQMRTRIKAVITQAVADRKV